MSSDRPLSSPLQKLALLRSQAFQKQSAASEVSEAPARDIIKLLLDAETRIVARTPVPRSELSALLRAARHKILSLYDLANERKLTLLDVLIAGKQK